MAKKNNAALFGRRVSQIQMDGGWYSHLIISIANANAVLERFAQMRWNA